ncbi:flagellar hook-length control protein FliK [Undibacterium terreum]|nr:flagellar hook-length control protein FliK [Undibacterium terreum]
MRTNSVPPQADFLPTAVSTKSASSDVSGPSFNQFLNKEIASPKSPSNSNNSNQNNVNNNNNDVNNNKDSSANNNQVDSKPADKPAQTDASGKTDKPTEAKDKDDDTNADQTAASADQTPGGQLIALVENLGKLAVDKAPSSDKSDDKKVDLSAITGAEKAGLADKSKQLVDAKADTDVTAGDKVLAAKDAGLKTDADLTGKKPVDSQLADKAGVQQDTDASKAKDVSTLAKVTTDSRDAAKDALQQIRSPAESTAGADQKLQAAQELASAKALMQDGAASVAPVQQNFAQQLAATASQGSTAAADHLAPRVGAAGWDQAVGQKVVWMVAGGKQTAELTLNPPDLGPMQVVLSVNNDKATATFVTAQPEVREALESAMPKLRQMMSDAGVQLSSFSFNTQSSNPGSQFAGNNNSSSSSNRFSHGLPDADIGSLPTVSSTVTSRGGNLGMVDTFA